MKTKMIEVLDRCTFIPCVAILMDPADIDGGYLVRRAGYGPVPLCVLFTRAHGGEAHHDPFAWGDRTMKQAHLYVTQNWDILRSGDVVDVEFVLGETQMMKRSESEGAL